MEEKIYELKKNEEVFNMTEIEITSERLLSESFIMMLRRLSIGEMLYYNDLKIEFKRIK